MSQIAVTRALCVALNSFTRGSLVKYLVNRSIGYSRRRALCAETYECNLCAAMNTHTSEDYGHQDHTTQSTEPTDCLWCCVEAKGFRGPIYVNKRTGPGSGVNEFRLVIPNADALCNKCFDISVNMVLWIRDNNTHRGVSITPIPSWKYIEYLPSPFIKIPGKGWNAYVDLCTKYGIDAELPQY